MNPINEVDKTYRDLMKDFRKIDQGKVRKRNAKKKRSKPAKFRLKPGLHLIDLPLDIFAHLTEFMFPRDLVALALTCTSMHQTIWNLTLHDLRHDCISEIEAGWNSNVEFVMKLAKYGQNFIGNRPDSVVICSREEGVAKDSYQAKMSWLCPCSVFPWQSHHLVVLYVYGPRDVDILSWYLNGEKMGYTIC